MAKSGELVSSRPLKTVSLNKSDLDTGDWVHIRNPNDLAKPIVAQIFRTWQNRDGQRWINACWYYRPEQTVHRFDRHFFDHEVVKTGQYRDHQIEDVLDRCFVMFVTRFNRGRPRGFPRSKEVYVCESRYNEEKARFVKIKTWASCVPDEVRDKDYEMDLFEGPPHRMRKLPSPIKHLLRDDAKETDDLPKPTWGSPNAPPIVGAVHRMPREPHVSTCNLSPSFASFVGLLLGEVSVHLRLLKQNQSLNLFVLGDSPAYISISRTLRLLYRRRSSPTHRSFLTTQGMGLVVPRY